jgi:hypothetical protein
MKVQLLVIALAGLTAAGCAGIDDVEGSIREAQGAGSARGGAGLAAPAQAQCAYSAGYQRSDNCCILPNYESGLDVDAAFSRAMQQYRFPANVQARHGNPARLYRYQSVRGQYHSAANDVRPEGDRALGHGVWLFLTLERETEKTSSVAAAYCEIPGRRPHDAAAWHAAVQASIHRTLPPK